MSDIQPGLYRHYKNKFYRVLGTARHSENPEDLFVVYQSLYAGDFPEGQLWIRPYQMFLETIEVNGRSVPRFEFIKEQVRGVYDSE